jgi:D-3-phosphoglycerate dehydrogenase
MINRLTTLIGGSEMNISEMTSKSKGEVEYTMLDLDTPASPELVDKISGIPGVWRVRIIK